MLSDSKEIKKDVNKPLVALLTNHEDDVYCFRKELIEKIVEEGYQILISCPYGEKLELMKETPFLYSDVEIDRRGTDILADLKLCLYYYKLFKKYKPNVVLGYTAKPNVYGGIMAYLQGIPYINNVTGLGSVINKKGFLKSLIMFLFKIAYSHATCVFFQNETNKDLALNQNMVKGEYKVIPGSGVDLQRFPLQEYPDDKKIVFNYIGRILKDKGIDDYIEVAELITSKYDNIEFNIIGFIEPTEIHYEKKLKELQEREIVYYRGSQKDVKPYIARSHATIHPSVYGEGMSNVLLESASSGRPLITTNNPGCREIVNDGVTGYIYEGGNVKELYNCVEKFIQLSNEDRKKMGELGRCKVADEFSRNIVVNEYLKKIHKICDK